MEDINLFQKSTLQTAVFILCTMSSVSTTFNNNIRHSKRENQILDKSTLRNKPVKLHHQRQQQDNQDFTGSWLNFNNDIHLNRKDTGSTEHEDLSDETRTVTNNQRKTIKKSHFNGNLQRKERIYMRMSSSGSTEGFYPGTSNSQPEGSRLLIVPELHPSRTATGNTDQWNKFKSGTTVSRVEESHLEELHSQKTATGNTDKWNKFKPEKAKNSANDVFDQDLALTDRQTSFVEDSHDSNVTRTTGEEAVTFSNAVSMPAQPNRLLGPLHGPDWMAETSRAARKQPLDTTTGIEGTFLWAVGLFGTIENGAIVSTSLFSRRFKKPLHILIGTLAATDLFISIIYIPAYTYFLLEGEQPETEETEEGSIWNFCTISRLLFIEIASVTLTIKVLISLYLYILSYSKALAEVIFTIKSTLLFIILAWITNFAMLFIPNFLGLNNVDFYPNGVICIPTGALPSNDDQSLLAYTILTLSLHLGELFVICVCFAKVHRAIQLGCSIWRQNKIPDSKNCLDDVVNYQRAKRITVMFFINFAVCWIPIYVVNIVDPSHRKLPKLLHHFAMDLLLLKSAVNPAIYMYGIRSLRREIKVVCMCRCRNSLGKNDKFGLYRTSMDSIPTSNSTRSAGVV